MALFVLLAIPLVATALGLPYYALDHAARLRHPLHALLKPSAGVGLGFGLAGFAFFLFMWLYPIRKHARWLSGLGRVASWLRVHVIVGLVLPFVVAVHAGWRFDGLIGLGYLALVLVCASGVIGRYVYVRIPRSKNGVELSLDDVTAERRAILTQLAAATGMDPGVIERALAGDPRSRPGTGLLAAFSRMLQNDMARARAMRAFDRQWRGLAHDRSPEERRRARDVLALARREIALRQQVQMLEATRSVFAFWHVAHRPVAITALLAILIHVVVAVWVGGVGIR